MIYVVITRCSDGTYDVYSFNSKGDAIKCYDLEYERKKSFHYLNSIQLFELSIDPNEPGVYPIFKPVFKYKNGKWVKTKFYKEFVFNVDKYFK